MGDLNKPSHRSETCYDFGWSDATNHTYQHWTVSFNSLNADRGGEGDLAWLVYQEGGGDTSQIIDQVRNVGVETTDRKFDSNVKIFASAWHWDSIENTWFQMTLYPPDNQPGQPVSVKWYLGAIDNPNIAVVMTVVG